MNPEPLLILIAPHPMLKLRCRPVGPADDAAIRALVPRMFAAMYQAPGIGLAAPQIAESIRLMIIEIPGGASR